MGQQVVHVDPPATRPRFHNVEPRSREERLAIRDKDMLEKLRLEHRLKSNVKEDLNSNLLEPPPNSAGFISEADRFCTDAAGEEYAERHRKKLEREVRGLSAMTEKRDSGSAHDAIFFRSSPSRAARRATSVAVESLFFAHTSDRFHAHPHTYQKINDRRNSSSVAACVTTSAKPLVGIASPWNKSLRTSNCRS